MDMLKKCFPLSFGAQDVTAMVIRLLIYVIAAFITGVVLWLAGVLIGWIPIIGLVIGLLLQIISWLIELYLLSGIVLLVLSYTKVLK